ncbi:hypothetical protein EV702DRAFT_1084617 [Suillus placidus]|uniref:Uncharacterized protein n=1 Tax=Suillus placidus TaxID=48579 RepID=A0A9P7D5T6_9AGAM|nr:hypothetical protein EV702DRAFT_1084617 [Suillus placidus]
MLLVMTARVAITGCISAVLLQWPVIHHTAQVLSKAETMRGCLQVASTLCSSIILIRNYFVPFQPSTSSPVTESPELIFGTPIPYSS